MREKAVDTHTIRFPRELKQRVMEKARKERRSFNAEVIWLIELGLELASRSKRQEGAE